MDQTINNQGFIPKKEKGSGPYQELYLEGLELVQKLSHTNWTDYNEHDPGVTILENLSYTLSDLLSRSELPINDLLTEGKGSSLESGDNGFFIPSDILTTNPITTSDYRKLIIDAITNVKNVWITTMRGNPTQESGSINGLYRIFVELHHYNSTPTKQKKEYDRIKNEVFKLFKTHRNLCEDLYNVKILDPFYIKLKIGISIHPEISGEEIYAQAFYRVNDYLSHSVQFNSLWDLQEDKMDTDQIFSGPQLENGFIRDSELLEQLREIDRTSIIRVISQIDGVISVDRLELYFNESSSTPYVFDQSDRSKSSLKIPKNCTARLVFPNSEQDVVLRNGTTGFNPNLKKVKKQLSYIEAMSYGSFKSVSESLNKIDIPQGQTHQTKNYYPLRHQFPLIYGIGDYGLPPKLPEKRYAQANQLKTYLLPFDQTMTNHLAQLTHVYDLFDSKSDKFRSYHFQQLDEKGELIDFFRPQDGVPTVEDKSEKQKLWNEEMSLFNSTFDKDAISRLNEAADHILARFGEEFPTYSMRKIHESTFGKSKTDETFEKQLLTWKRKLISNYDKLSYNRARAINYHGDLEILENGTLNDINNNLVPGLVQKICMLTGIENYSIRSLTLPVLNSKFNIYHKQAGISMISDKLNIVNLEPDSAILSIDDVVIIDDKVENLRDDFYFVGNVKRIFEETLRYGCKHENYEIRKTDRDKNNDYFILLKKNNDKKSVVHLSDSSKNAKNAIDEAVSFLSDLSTRCEGLYLIEHILLAPKYNSNQFGFSFKVPLKNNKINELKFKQIELQSYNKRNQGVSKIAEEITQKDLSNIDGFQLRTIAVEGEYRIQIMDGNGVQMAESTKGYSTQLEANNQLKSLKEELPFISQNEILKSVKSYAYYGQSKRVNEEFFSHRMSFMLPSWPARFQNENFRHKFESLVYEEAPIHIASQSFWLDIHTMTEFEKIYYQWLNFNVNDHGSKNQMDLAYKLVSKIQEYVQSSPN